MGTLALGACLLLLSVVVVVLVYFFISSCDIKSMSSSASSGFRSVGCVCWVGSCSSNVMVFSQCFCARLSLLFVVSINHLPFVVDDFVLRILVINGEARS